MSDGATQAKPTVLAPPNPPTSWFGGVGVALRNMWHERQLIREFVLRDIRLKYRGSAFGYVWTVLEPLLMSAVFVVLFSILSRMPDRTYVLGVVLGVILWSYFAAALTKAQASLTHNAHVIEQIYVPREVFGVAGVLAQLIMAAFSLAVAVPFLLFFRLLPTWTVVYIPLGLLLLTALALGVGLLSAPFNVLNRDVEYFTAFLMRAGMYLSPVMWSVDALPAGRMRDWMLLNPVVVPMEMVKAGVQGKSLAIAPGLVGYAIAVCLGALVVGLAVFRRLEGAVVKKL